MGIFNWFKKSNKGVTLTQEEWERREQLRRDSKELQDATKNADLRIMLLEKKAKELELEYKVKELEADIDEDFGEEDQANDPQTMFAGILSQVLAKPQAQQQQANTSQTSSSPAVVVPTDAQIEEIWQAIPDWQKAIAKEMPDDKIIEYIKSKQPNVTPEVLAKAIKLIRR